MTLKKKHKEALNQLLNCIEKRNFDFAHSWLCELENISAEITERKIHKEIEQ